MNKTRFALKACAFVVFTLAMACAAQAQATRTWVSGVGDDVNPCSRTAPCKTFAGAISKTFIAGEIDCLDPGGFGTITITKSITIDGGATFASILASGTNGVNVNFTSVNANDPEKRVTLRRLSINGTGASGAVGQRTGLKGINVTTPSALSLYVENCYIQHFSQQGIDTSGVTASGVYVSVKDTNIQNCNVGINLATTSGFTVGLMDNVRIEKMTSNAVSIGNGANMKARNCTILFNGGDGFSITNTVANASLALESTFIASNGTGVRNGATGSVVDLSNTSILFNGTGIASSSAALGGGVNSHGNNQIASNTSAGTAPNVIGQQ
jgi:hypothetical protein